MKQTAYDRHLKNAINKRHIWKESEIVAVRSRIHHETADRAQILIDMLNNTGGYRITPEQTQKGIDYLKGNLWTASGKAKNNAVSRCFGVREKAIILKFKKFTFEGVRYDMNTFSMRFSTTPIYRVHAKDGSYFDYTVAHFGVPEVL